MAAERQQEISSTKLLQRIIKCKKDSRSKVGRRTEQAANAYEEVPRRWWESSGVLRLGQIFGRICRKTPRSQLGLAGGPIHKLKG